MSARKPRRVRPFYVSPCDDENVRTWDVLRRSDGGCMEQQIRTRDEARHVAFVLNADAEAAERRAKGGAP